MGRICQYYSPIDVDLQSQELIFLSRWVGFGRKYIIIEIIQYELLLLSIMILRILYILEYKRLSLFL